MGRLKKVMVLLIANDVPLGPEWLDHALGGEWDGHRECHIGGDFLLAYKLDDSGKVGQVTNLPCGIVNIIHTITAGISDGGHSVGA